MSAWADDRSPRVDARLTLCQGDGHIVMRSSDCRHGLPHPGPWAVVGIGPGVLELVDDPDLALLPGQCLRLDAKGQARLSPSLRQGLLGKPRRGPLVMLTRRLPTPADPPADPVGHPRARHTAILVDPNALAAALAAAGQGLLPLIIAPGGVSRWLGSRPSY